MASQKHLPEPPGPPDPSRSPREQVNDRISAERQYWLDLVDCIDPATRHREIDGNTWELRPLLAHLVVWRDRTLAVITAEAFDRSRPVDPWPESLGEDVDAINAWLDSNPLDLDEAGLIDRYTRSFDQMQQLIDDLGDDQLIDPDLVPFIGGMSLEACITNGRLFEHLHVEHGKDLRTFANCS